MQDLFQNYVSDLINLRELFQEELPATAAELSKAMGEYSQRSEAALTSFMEKVSARGVALEAAAAARFDQFRGLPAKGGLPNVSDGPLAQTPTNADQDRSKPSQSGRSQIACMSRAMRIVSCGRLPA